MRTKQGDKQTGFRGKGEEDSEWRSRVGWRRNVKADLGKAGGWHNRARVIGWWGPWWGGICLTAAIREERCKQLGQNQASSNGYYVGAWLSQHYGNPGLSNRDSSSIITVKMPPEVQPTFQSGMKQQSQTTVRHVTIRFALFDMWSIIYRS